ncbi:MAG: sugar phosphate isomerase/epimerase [Verrucomicrobia bacterium]|nr:sugar phosphate isomerase/epimerase [Verrucomicrobiota bacterium]
MSRIISVSTAPYDGYEVPAILDSVASCGATHVEPAFIVGYTEPFEESAFNDVDAEKYAAWLRQSGLGCFAFSSHIDLGTPKADRVFARRMDFAAALGARVINTNAALRDHADAFSRNIETLAAHAERRNMIIALENPGNGENNLFNVARDGLDLVERIGSPYVRLNYDAGNTVSHRPGQVDPAQDALAAMPACAHVHIKDVQIRPEGYFFVPLGEGEVGCATILQAMRDREDLNLAIELPLRLHRDPAAQPVRQSSRVDLLKIESALRRSLAFVRKQLS